VMSTINRNSGTHQPVPTRQASTGSAHQRQANHCQQLGSNAPAGDRTRQDSAAPLRAPHLRVRPGCCWLVCPLRSLIGMRSQVQGQPAGGRPKGSSDEFPDELKVDASLRPDRGRVPSGRLGPGPPASSVSSISFSPSCRTQTPYPPKSSVGSSLRRRSVLPSVTSSLRKGGAAREATHRRLRSLGMRQVACPPPCRKPTPTNPAPGPSVLGSSDPWPSSLASQLAPGRLLHARRSTVPRFQGEGRHRPARHHKQHGVLVPIDNCDRVESLSALPRRSAGVLP
jgi:hypothetical protein